MQIKPLQKTENSGNELNKSLKNNEVAILSAPIDTRFARDIAHN
jgi:hypothetical protein